ISGDAQHRRLFREDAVLAIQLTSYAHGYAARSFGEDAFGLRQQADRVHYLGIADILAPAAALLDGLDRVVAIGRIANRKRSRNGRGLLRFDLSASGLYRGRNRRASRGLRAEELHWLVFDQPKLD